MGEATSKASPTSPSGLQAAPSTVTVSPKSSAGFRKVQVVEESDSEEELHDGDNAASAPAPGTPSGGSFHKVQIVEESDSEGNTPASGSPTGEAAASKSFQPPPRVADSSDAST